MRVRSRHDRDDPPWWESFEYVQEFTDGGQSCSYLVKDKQGKLHVIKVPDRTVAVREHALTCLAHARYPKGTVHPEQICHPADESPYLVLPYLLGSQLKDLVHNPRGLTFAHLGYIFMQMARCLTAWQDPRVTVQGQEEACPLFWGDLASYNAMFFVSPHQQPHLTAFDFGSAYLGNSDCYNPASPLRQRLATCATPGAIPPEQILESAEHHQIFNPTVAETYGLAVMAYQLLTGQDPYQGMADVVSNFDLITRLRQDMIPIQTSDLQQRFGGEINNSRAVLTAGVRDLNELFLNALSFWLRDRTIRDHNLFVRALLFSLEQIAVR